MGKYYCPNKPGCACTITSYKFVYNQHVLNTLLGNIMGEPTKSSEKDVEYLKHENVCYLPDSKQAMLYKLYLHVKTRISLNPNAPPFDYSNKTPTELIVINLAIRDARNGGLSSFKDMMNFIKQNTGNTTV